MGVSDQSSLFEPERHGHLRLAAATDPGQRQPRSPGFGGSTTYRDRSAHGRALATQVAQISASHQRRVSSLGVDPELILVLETNASLDPAEIERAGLVPLEIRSDRALIAFAADPELAEFVSRNDKYQEGTRGLTEQGNERRAAYETLFDKIDSVRTIDDSDLVGASLAELIIQSPRPTGSYRLEIHCWCPEDAAEARRRNEEVAKAVEAASGRVLHKSVRPTAGWSAICCDLPLDQVSAILATERVSWINVMPKPLLEAPQLLNATHTTLPPIVGPPAGAPIVAVVDSGIRSAHPMLATAIVGVEYVGAGLGDGGDESGHGTLVSSLALFGNMEAQLAAGEPLVAAGRLLSVRVLDRDNRFADDVTWPDTVLAAMELAAEAGSKVINLSLGDPRKPYLPTRPTAVAALVDTFIREHPDIVVVTCAGNQPVQAHSVERLTTNGYIEDLLAQPSSGILDPGTSALALTVGGLGGAIDQGVNIRSSAERVLVGGPGLPSPFTRVGPGPMGAIKPEISAPSGTVLVDTLYDRAIEDRSVQIVGAGGAQPDKLLAASHGTSFAAPLVSNAALRIATRYPAINGNSIRALVLVGTRRVERFLEPDNAANRSEQRRLVGYGQLSAERSEISEDHRVVLLSEAALVVDQVHFYRVPVPSSFRQSGGTRSLTVALAFDPPVRVTRLDYLASKMSFQVFHGPTLAEVRAAYVRAEEDEELSGDVDAAPASLKSAQLDLQPTDTARSRGTNQFAQYLRSKKVPDDKPDEYIVAVRNLNRWDTPGASQAYSFAIALERDREHGELYTELRAELEPISIEVEQEIEI